jgi:hypothetical protein
MLQMMHDCGVSGMGIFKTHGIRNILSVALLPALVYTISRRLKNHSELGIL